MSAPDSLVTDDLPALRVSPRLDGLDWLRAGAAVLVVALHAGIAYLVARMPGLAWATNDPVGSPVVDGLTWWINGFIMPLFFLQSGFLACQLMRRKGPRDFLAHRSRRLLGPLALGGVLILPLDLYAWLLGWAGDGKITLRKLKSLKIDSPLGDNMWGVSHLWFLEYLWLFCVAAWVGSRVAKWQSGKVAEGRRRRLQTLMPIGLLGISAVALWWEPKILIGFRHSWWPLPANLMFYGPWFAMGWFVGQTFLSAEFGKIKSRSPAHSQPRQPFASLCEWRVAASLGLFAILLPLIHRHVLTASGGWERVALAGLFVLHAWLIVTGLFGVSLRWLNHRPPPAVKYVAEASFWIYLFHHPVVGLAQVSLSQASLPVAAKFAITLVIGLVLPLLTYQAFVRRTWIGVLLSGHRLGVGTRPTTADLLPLPVPEPQRLKKSA